MNDIRRTILWVIFGFSMVLLWDQWQIHNGKQATFFPNPTQKAASAPAPAASASAGVPVAPAVAGQAPVAESAAAVASEVSRLASAFSGARVALLASAGWLQSDPIGYLGSAADRAGDAARLCEGAAGDVSRLAARVVVRGGEFGGVAT